MMFNNKFIACLKSDGKILREFKDTVYIPWQSEYSIYLKNLNSVRAVVNITIDGTDVAPGGLVVNANSEINLERFIKDGNLLEGNRFKFIERTSKCEQHRGVKAEDGIIRISFRYEKVMPKVNTMPYFVDNTGQWNDAADKWYGAGGPGNEIKMSKNVLRGRSGGIGGSSNAVYCSATANGSNTVTTQGIAQSTVVNDIGITVPGSVSEQRFVQVTGFLMELEEHVLVLRILGETAENAVVTKPITVKTKARCTTCNHLNKAVAKFCNECGTSLTIV